MHFVLQLTSFPGLASSNACGDERLMAIFNYIQSNYQTVTLSDVANHFHLTEPYISKYIKSKSGKTFVNVVSDIRMKKAKTLLKNGTMTVEKVAMSVGYPNVEHFNRVFKKRFNQTPTQYRKM